MRYFRSPKISEMWARLVWCEEMFGSQLGEKRYRCWYRDKGYIWFKHKEDLTLFVLRWS
jgi:hypothetical protein